MLDPCLWGHVILHIALLVLIRPATYHKYSPLQLAYDHESNISHLKSFEYVVYVQIAPPQRTKMDPQRRLKIYVGFDSYQLLNILNP